MPNQSIGVLDRAFFKKALVAAGAKPDHTAR